MVCYFVAELLWLLNDELFKRTRSYTNVCEGRLHTPETENMGLILLLNPNIKRCDPKLLSIKHYTTTVIQHYATYIKTFKKQEEKTF